MDKFGDVYFGLQAFEFSKSDGASAFHLVAVVRAGVVVVALAPAVRAGVRAGVSVVALAVAVVVVVLRAGVRAGVVRAGVRAGVVEHEACML